jgi:hypothetical protein
MCGLVAMFTEAKAGFTSMEVKAFQEAFYINALRGEDASGLVVLDNYGETSILKTNTHAFPFAKENDTKILFARALSNGKALLGHNRKKTVGRDIEENAHPFVIEDRFVFMHNGTLTNHKEIGNHEVDSESLAHLIAPLGEDVTKLEEALGKVRGAYACIWLDTKLETLYWVRNSERPLWKIKIPQGYFLSSEPGIGLVPLGRNHIEGKEVEACKIDTLYSFNLQTGGPVKEEGLSIKKALPPYQGATHSQYSGRVLGGSQKTHVLPTKGMTSTGVSKNAFKALRRRLLQTPIRFWVDDWIEKYYPHETSEWLLFGSSELFDRAIIKGDINVTKSELEDKWDGGLCNAIVEDVVYDAKDKNFSILVKDVRLIPKSRVVQ